jgi:hypothetical protein
MGRGFRDAVIIMHGNTPVMPTIGAIEDVSAITATVSPERAGQSPSESIRSSPKVPAGVHVRPSRTHKVAIC